MAGEEGEDPWVAGGEGEDRWVAGREGEDPLVAKGEDSWERSHPLSSLDPSILQFYHPSSIE